MTAMRSIISPTNPLPATPQVRTMKDVQEVLKGTRSEYLLDAIRRLATFVQMVDLSTIPADIEWLNEEFPEVRRGVHPRPDLPSKLPAYKKWRADLLRAVTIATGERDAKTRRKSRVDGWTGILEAINLHSRDGGILYRSAGSQVSKLADLCRKLDLQPWQLDDEQALARLKASMPAPQLQIIRKALAFLQKWRFLPELAVALPASPVLQMPGVRETRRLPKHINDFIEELVAVAANELDEVMGADSRRVSKSTLDRYRASLKHHFRILPRCPDDARVRYTAIKDLHAQNDCAALLGLEHLKATIRQTEAEIGKPSSITDSTACDYYSDIIVILSRNGLIDARAIKAIHSSSFLRKAKAKRRSMTEDAERWCRDLLNNPERERRFRNLHRLSMAKAEALIASIAAESRMPTPLEQSRICHYGVVAAASAIEYAGSPIRLSNVISLRFRGKTQNFFPPAKKGDNYSFEVSADETKAKRAVNRTEIRKEAFGTAVLDWYFREIYPRFSHAATSNYLFPSPELADKPISKAGFNKIFQNISNEFDIPMTFHNFRHGCATLILKANPESVSAAAALLGNTVAVCAKNYGFIDKDKVIRHGQGILHSIAVEAAK